VRARQLSNSGSALIGMGRYREAESLLREALEIYAIHYGSGPHPRVAAAENNLARALLLAGDYDASAAHMIRARELAEQLFGTRDPRFVVATGNLGDLERRRGNLQRAEELLIENLELRRTLLGGEHRSVGNGLALLANLRLDQGRWESALQLCDEALALFNRVGFESPETLIATHTRRARALAGLGRMDEADTALEETLSIAQAAPDDAGMSWLELLSARARFLQGQRDSRAPEAIRQALDEHRRMLGAEHPTTRQLQAWSEPDLENAPQVR
jgi:tetratricopeptide (TPR) repeat protein